MTFTEKHQRLNELILEARKLESDYGGLILASEFVVQTTLKMQDIVNGFITEDSEEQIEKLTDLLLKRDEIINKVVC